MQKQAGETRGMCAHVESLDTSTNTLATRHRTIGKNIPNLQEALRCRARTDNHQADVPLEFRVRTELSSCSKLKRPGCPSDYEQLKAFKKAYGFFKKQNNTDMRTSAPTQDPKTRRPDTKSRETTRHGLVSPMRRTATTVLNIS